MLFSKALYGQSLKNMKNTAIGGAIVFIVLNAVVAILGISGKFFFKHPESVEEITGGYILPLCFLIIPITFLLVFSAFSFLNARKASDFYYALSQKRICLFLSICSAIISYVLFIILLSLLINSLIFTIGKYTLNLKDIASVFSGLSASAFTVMGISLICRILSGTTASFVMYSVCALWGGRAVLHSFKYLFEMVNHSVVTENTFLKYFSVEWSWGFPFFTALENDNDFFNNRFFILYLFIETIILFVISAFLFVKRKSELAEKPAPSKWINGFFKVIFLSAILLLNYDVPLFSIILTIVVSFLMDIIIFRKESDFLKSLVSFLIAFGTAFGLSICCFLVSEAFIMANPSPEEIVSLSIRSENTENAKKVFELSDAEKSDLICELYNGLSTKNKDVIVSISSALKESVKDDNLISSDSRRFTVSFKMKNGKEKLRSVKFEKDLLIDFITAVKSEEENKSLFILPQYSEIEKSLIVYHNKHFPQIYNFSLTEELYNTFAEEYNALSSQKMSQCEVKKDDYAGIIIAFATSEKNYSFYVNSTDFPITAKKFYPMYLEVKKDSPQKFINALNNLKESCESENAFVYTVEFENDVMFLKLDPNHPNFDSLLKLATAEALSEYSEDNLICYFGGDGVFLEGFIISVPKNVLSVLKTFKTNNGMSNLFFGGK